MAAWDGINQPYARGGTLDKPTALAIAEAEKLAGFKFRVTQAKTVGAGVAASAGTHDGYGAIDIHTRTLTEKQRRAIVLALRRVGFAAWQRFTPTFSSPHIHAVLMDHSGLSGGAKRQIAQYRDGRSGLASRGPDQDKSYASGYYGWSWPKYLASKAKAPTTPPAPASKPGGPTISITAIRTALTGNVSGQYWEDVRYVLAVAAATHAIPATTLNAALGTQGQAAKGLPKLLGYTLKCIQARNKLPQTGIFDAGTQAVFGLVGYRIVP